ncbi:MAG: hypothetical protein II147_04470 [Lachnospiraceae bacterium]|nr:hypothetical protein [Lachnospiraceae bacterium]
MRSLDKEIVRKRNMSESYRVITPDIASVKVFEVGMMTECNIRSLLKMDAMVLSGGVSYNYKISGLLSLDNVRKSGKLTGEVVNTLFKSLYNCFDEIADYMLTPGNILLMQSEVFFTDDLRKALFMYVPKEEAEQMSNEEIIDFAEEILNTAENIDREVIMYMYTLICELKEENGTLKTAIEKAARITFSEETKEVKKEKPMKSVRIEKVLPEEEKDPSLEEIRKADEKAKKKAKRQKKKNEVISERKKKLLEYMDFSFTKHDKFNEKKEDFNEEDYEEKDSELVYLA